MSTTLAKNQPTALPDHTRIVPPSYKPVMVGTTLTAGEVSEEPLVSIYPCENLENGYHLFVTLYLPSGSSEVYMHPDFDNVERIDTRAGKIEARLVTITYTTTKHALPDAYDIWHLHCLYQVGKDEGADAIHVITKANDPVTRRGTVTTVIRT